MPANYKDGYNNYDDINSGFSDGLSDAAQGNDFTSNKTTQSDGYKKKVIKKVLLEVNKNMI
ncbi:hypothetical protein [Holzapfeliella floricola]|uniref:hypothetical protein n=1 Tax=Holzapfeliella floricola TaxID=679249 RepID=UPI000782907D|nr:hypothetical protein [Holzapfeliella floricola]